MAATKKAIRAYSKDVNQTRNKRCLLFISGLYPRWLRPALNTNIRENMRAKGLIVTFSVVILTLLTNSSVGSQCLDYEPSIVELTGTMKSVVFPGRPNYESVKEGDEPETHWVLYLDSAICVNGDPKDNFKQAETKIKSLQLLIGNYNKYRHLLGQKVTVKGMLTHGFTAHHHTPVMLGVRDLWKALN
jgi:hypothetical protein